jgi:Peptidase M15.
MRRLLIGCLIGLIATAALAAKPGGPVTLQLTYTGLPTITYVVNTDGRVTDVTMTGRPIVSYDWSAVPYEVPVRFFNRWSIITSVLPDGSAAQQVSDSRGVQRAFGSVPAHGREFRRPSALLDVYAADLGLAEGWQAAMNTTSPNDVRLQANGKAVNIHFRRIGDGVRVAEADGKPVLWDIDLPLGVDGRLGQLVPSRLIVTSTGAVQLAPDIPVVDGIESIWTNDASGSHSSFGILRADTTVRSANAGPHANMMVVCGFTEFDSCWDYPGGSVCDAHVYLSYCDVGGGGGYTPPDDGSGGAGTPPPTDPEITQLQGQYTNCPPTPAASDFITSAQFSDPQGHFSFGELSDPSYNHAIITADLINGLESTRTNYGGSIVVNSGYRAPGTNAGTPGSAACSDHIRGTAADLNIRNATGAHDCAVWDALAAAGHAARAWVESWAELVSNKTPNHVHLDFGRAQNQPADYGTCDPSQLP